MENWVWIDTFLEISDFSRIVQEIFLQENFIPAIKKISAQKF